MIAGVCAKVTCTDRAQTFFCLAAGTPEDCLLVVGGSGRYMNKGSVEIGRLQCH